MTDTVRDEITQLAASIRAFERQLETALAKRHIELNYKVQDGVAQFEQVVIERHRLLKARLLKYVFGVRPAMILSAPAIYALIIPFLLLDLFVMVYQIVCFPVYGIPRVRRTIIWHSTEDSSRFSMRSRSSIARTAPTRTMCSPTSAKSLPVLKSTGAP